MRSLEDLSHVSRPLSSGGEILVLDTGAVIDAESQAMLGALYSRSPKGIHDHLRLLARKGPGAFMESFYVGYGHKSIGDLGNAAVFIDGCSILAAKAIQDFPLYNGQEISTRYVDFATAKFFDPVGSVLSHEILERWRDFYIAGLPQTVDSLKERFPRQPNEDERVYEKAIKARAFDIMRGFLPAGAATGVAWMGNLRQFADRLPELRHNPLPEVREIGETLEDALIEMYPHSFSKKRYPASEAYYESMGAFAYFEKSEPLFFSNRCKLDLRTLARYRPALEKHVPKTELPFAVRDAGQVEFEFPLDFGSFRDIQRQRAVSILMPLLSNAHDFEEWYVEELPVSLQEAARSLVADQRAEIRTIPRAPEIKQYYLPMGLRVPVRLVGDLRALVYLVELRTTRFVHPTLRKRAWQMTDSLIDIAGPYGLVLHLDEEPNRFDIKRGEQDIVLK